MSKYLFLLSFLFSFQASAQTQNVDSLINEITNIQELAKKDSLIDNLASLAKDSLKRDVRFFEKVDIEKYKTDSRFQYETVVPQDISFLDRFNNFLNNHILNLSKKEISCGTTVSY